MALIQERTRVSPGGGGGGTQSGKGYQLQSDHWRAVAVATSDRDG